MASRSSGRLTDTSPVSMSMLKIPLGSRSEPGPVRRKKWLRGVPGKITWEYNHAEMETYYQIYNLSFHFVTGK